MTLTPPHGRRARRPANPRNIVGTWQQDIGDGECLTASVPSPEYLLATKLLASRVGRDEDDILLLYDLCGLSTVDEGLALVQRYYPGRPVEAKVRF